MKKKFSQYSVLEVDILKVFVMRCEQMMITATGLEPGTIAS